MLARGIGLLSQRRAPITLMNGKGGIGLVGAVGWLSQDRRLRRRRRCLCLGNRGPRPRAPLHLVHLARLLDHRRLRRRQIILGLAAFDGVDVEELEDDAGLRVPHITPLPYEVFLLLPPPSVSPDTPSHSPATS